MPLLRSSRVSNGSWFHGKGLASDHKNSSVCSQTYLKTTPAAYGQTKVGAIPVNAPVLLGLARLVGSNLELCFFGFSISDCIQISYC